MQYYKINQPFTFDKVIYLDRYMKESSDNPLQQMKDRDLLSTLDKQIQDLEDRLKNWDNNN